MQDGNTSLQLALQQKHTEIVQYFVKDTKLEATQLDEVAILCSTMLINLNFS